MKKEILILLVIIGAFAFFQSISFVRMPQTKGSPLVLQTEEANFYSNLSAAGDWALLEFWAPWCAPCRKLKPAINALAEEKQDQLKILAVNMDKSPSLANEFQISGTPTLILMYKGREVARRVGGLPKPVLINWVEGFIDPETPSAP